MAVALAVESGLVCAALSTGRYIFVNSLAQKKSVQDLCEFDPREVQPKVVHVGKVSLFYSTKENLKYFSLGFVSLRFFLLHRKSF